MSINARKTHPILKIINNSFIDLPSPSLMFQSYMTSYLVLYILTLPSYFLDFQHLHTSILETILFMLVWLLVDMGNLGSLSSVCSMLEGIWATLLFFGTSLLLVVSFKDTFFQNIRSWRLSAFPCYLV